MEANAFLKGCRTLAITYSEAVSRGWRLDHGASPDTVKWAHNRNGYGSGFDWGSALNTTLHCRRLKLAEELLCRGVRIDLFRASWGETVLEIAARWSPEMVPLIEECRAREQEHSEQIS
ncbi:hypothetical protein RRF57_008816 [Xylaria bambusicola]|uniref:Uncharacterized protein n=1 Tax=Xylaria bambusicola TaxID=326684 RepID=A0AAN7UPZ6_9PEZI